MQEELPDLDLSLFSFDEFVLFFFDRRVVSDKELFDYFHSDLAGTRYEAVAHSSPATLVRHLTQLFTVLGDIGRRFSLAQVDQGVWAMLGPTLHLGDVIFDSRVLLAERLACIRGMYHVFADYVSKLEGEMPPDSSGSYMWWDLLLHDFWIRPPHLSVDAWGNMSILDAEERGELDVMFETLTRILALPDRECQKSALHGLGHLHHPGVRGVVQVFIDANPGAFDLKWLEQCRDGEAP